MGYDDDEEFGDGEGVGHKRPRTPSPPKPVDVEKIKPNTEENKGEIRSAHVANERQILRSVLRDHFLPCSNAWLCQTCKATHRQAVSSYLILRVLFMSRVGDGSLLRQARLPS